MVVVLFATKVEKLRSWGTALAMESCTLIWALVPKRIHYAATNKDVTPLICCDWCGVIHFLPWNAAWLLAKQYIMSEFRKLSYSVCP